jgi:two-component system, OmpR family, sensor kinase
MVTSWGHRLSVADPGVGDPGTTADGTEGSALGDRPASPGEGPKAPAEVTRARRSVRWRSTFARTRTRLVLAYLAVLVVSTTAEMLLIGHVLQARLEARVDATLVQEIEEFTHRIGDGSLGAVAGPVTRAFDAALAGNVPDEHEAFVALVNGEIHGWVLDRYPTTRFPTDALATWTDFSAAGGAAGEQLVGTYEDALGTAFYRAVHITDGRDHGAFVVTLLPSDEWALIGELRVAMVLVLGVAVAIAGGLAWLLTSRLLAPLEAVTASARAITSPDTITHVEARGSTEATELVANLNAMLARLEDAHRAQREFLAAAGHQLRAPLTVVAGHLELLTDDEDDRRTTLPLVLDEVHRMGKIVGQLGSLAASETPGFLQVQPLELGRLTHELFAKAGSLAERRWVLDAVADEVVEADRDRLTEAMLNLLENAVAHTDPGAEIGLGTSSDPDEVRLWVRDTGVGIAVGEQGRVFERFARGQEASRRYRGAGIGLTLVLNIARAHGGRVDVTSRPGEGACFTLVLSREACACR